MNKKALRLTVFLLAAALCPGAPGLIAKYRVFAAGSTVSVTYYDGTEENTVILGEAVSSDTGAGTIELSVADGVLAIPETIDGKTVAGLGEYALGDPWDDDFSLSTTEGIRTIQIPAQVTAIDRLAFRSCVNLEAFEVAEGCKNYRSEDGVLYEINSSYTDSGSTEPDSQEIILLQYPYAKQDESFTVPDYVYEIGQQSFKENPYIKEIIVSEGVEDIEGRAFASCTSLERLSLPSTLRQIYFMIVNGEGVFTNTPMLETITVAEGSAYYYDLDGVLYEYGSDGDTLICYPEARTAAEFEVPAGVAAIEYCAFQSNPYIEKITLPSTVTNIYSYAFYQCTSLKEVCVDSAANPFLEMTGTEITALFEYTDSQYGLKVYDTDGKVYYSTNAEGSGTTDTGSVQTGNADLDKLIQTLAENIFGYADLTDTFMYLESSTAWNNLGWDSRSGILEADAADLDGDGADELLLYRFEKDTDSQYENGNSPTALYVDVYQGSGSSYILLDKLKLFSDSNVNFHLVRGGLTEVNGQTCLYVETEMIPYFADGSDSWCAWYGLAADGTFRELWGLGKSDGGSSEIAYSLLDYTESAEEPVKTVLWAGDDWRYYYPDTPVLTEVGTDLNAALAQGFALLGIPEVTVEARNTGFSSAEECLTLWDKIEPSFSYLCSGARPNEESYSAWNLTVTVKNRARLAEEPDNLTVVQTLDSAAASQTDNGETEESGGNASETAGTDVPLITLQTEATEAETSEKDEAEDYVIADSDKRYLTEADVENLTLQQINYAKNEIYARRGRKFLSPELQNYFNSKSWYQGTIDPEDFTDEYARSVMNEYEYANAAFLSEAEYARDQAGYALDQ